MNISKLLVAAILATAVGAAAAPVTPAVPAAPATPAAPAAPAITLSGVTGVVQIKTASGGVMTVKAGEPIPEIPAGSEIVVVSGDVTVNAGGASIKANAGDSFTVNTTGTGAIDIAVTGGSVSIVGANGVAKEVAKGEGLIVATTAPATPATPATPTAKAPESIPADASTETVIPTPVSLSPTQETAVVSPSAP